MTLPTSNQIIESQGNIAFVQLSTLLPVLYYMPFDDCSRLYCKKRTFYMAFDIKFFENSVNRSVKNDNLYGF